ncbi:MAG TPA: hypothetical protein VMJ10_04265 [Kofleriaceae bacterium]|nr:hypothetical protein [Kofleriaceae bacterium]
MIDFAAAVITGAVPLALAAMCGAITERAGVIDLALEAKLLFGAFAAAAVALATGSPWLGLLGGMAAGMAVALAQLGCALWLYADQVIVGVGLNILALGGTRYLLALLYHEGANSPELQSTFPPIAGNPIVWLAVAAAIAVPLALARTRWGLRLRAAGDRPDALVAVGVAPRRARLAAALVGGALAGAGGAQLSLSVYGFVADMSGGRGYIALAMVILSGWRPGYAALASVGLAIANQLAHKLEMWVDVLIVRELAHLLPYVLTLLVLAIWGSRRPPPASLGKP